jgi:hypothetical protein
MAPNDKPAVEASDQPGKDGPDKLDEMQDRLEQVDDRIREARHDAQEDRLIPGKQENYYYESGDEQSERADDQEIAP